VDLLITYDAGSTSIAQALTTRAELVEHLSTALEVSIDAVLLSAAEDADSHFSQDEGAILIR
jgi:hypothetical protein